MHNLILITGPQGSGKSRLASLMRNAKEVDGAGLNNTEILREIWHEKDFKEVVVVTVTSANYILRRMLQNCAKELKCNYTHYEIYQKERQEEITHTEAEIQTVFRNKPGYR